MTTVRRPAAAASGSTVRGHLQGEFAGGQQDQAARLSGDAAAAGEPGDQRDGERDGLAGAGLAAAQHVPAGQGRRAASPPGSGTGAIAPSWPAPDQRRGTPSSANVTSASGAASALTVVAVANNVEAGAAAPDTRSGVRRAGAGPLEADC